MRGAKYLVSPDCTVLKTSDCGMAAEWFDL